MFPAPCSVAMLFFVCVIQAYVHVCMTTLHFIKYLMKKIKICQDVKYLSV